MPGLKISQGTFFVRSFLMSTTIQSLERALDILEMLGNHPGGIQVKDLSQELALNKSTVSRMLHTLGERGYVQKKEDGSYRLGIKIVELCSLHLNSLQLKTEALPAMEQLRNQTGLIIHLGALDDGEIVYLEKLTSYANIRMYSQIGKRAYLHSTGMGRAILSAMTNKEVLKIVKEKGMPAITEKTCVKEEELLKQLEQVRQRGYAIDDEENEIGMRCVAAPIFDYRGDVIAAVSATGFLEMLPYERIEEVAEYTMKCADDISACMGYRRKSTNNN